MCIENLSIIYTLLDGNPASMRMRSKEYVNKHVWIPFQGRLDFPKNRT